MNGYPDEFVLRQGFHLPKQTKIIYNNFQTIYLKTVLNSHPCKITSYKNHIFSHQLKTIKSFIKSMSLKHRCNIKEPIIKTASQQRQRCNTEKEVNLIQGIIIPRY